MARSFFPLKIMLFRCVFWHLRKGVKNDFMLLGILDLFVFSQVVPPLFSTSLNYCCLPQTVFLHYSDICKSVSSLCRSASERLLLSPALGFSQEFVFLRQNSSHSSYRACIPSILELLGSKLSVSLPLLLQPFAHGLSGTSVPSLLEPPVRLSHLLPAVCPMNHESHCCDQPTKLWDFVWGFHHLFYRRRGVKHGVVQSPHFLLCYL